jgi:broad specificity phosphatase PhoE
VAGAGNDSCLTARGREQAIAAARELAAQPIVAVYSSTALRARQTAELLATTRGLHVTAVPELVEAECTAEQLRSWVVEEELGRCTEDGETGSACVARVTAAFERIAGAHPSGTVAIVGHVASLTVALARMCSLGAAVWGQPLPNARPFLVEWDGQVWHCPTWPADDGLPA